MAAPHLSVQMGSLHGRYVYYGIYYKNVVLEQLFPPDAIGRCHEDRNIPCFNVLIQKEDNAPQATIDLVIETIGLSNHLLNHTEPSEVQSKLFIRDKWA